jgi:hypothetical protein
MLYREQITRAGFELTTLEVILGSNKSNYHMITNMAAVHFSSSLTTGFNNVVSRTSYLRRVQTHNISGDRH